MAALTRVDCSDASYVVVCRCGYRFTATSKPAALRIAQEHRSEQHRRQAANYRASLAARTPRRSTLRGVPA